MVLALFRETQIGALQNFLEQNRTFCYVGVAFPLTESRRCGSAVKRGRGTLQRNFERIPK